ncbi:SseB family protein [Nocardioides houyundeii]|uniref:SseB family protein n=1 Tax=Nocardioides houyundeii TaxID=2045452 RepID=UPI000C76FAEA|nr:SseB family protein [Nocardioides houyundeii]
MVDPHRFDGARILESSFPDDTGAADPALSAALAAFAAGSGGFAEVVQALAPTRVLVPVVAVLGEVEVDDQGLAHDKSSDMAAVLLTGADGRLALLAFTSSDSLTRWSAEARPVPVPAQVAAQSAVQEGAAALVIDVAGPSQFVLEGEDLAAFAAGWTLTRVGDDLGWLRPAE